MMRVAVFLAALVAVTPAHAGFRGCYQRIYDKAFLKNNNIQLAGSMAIQYGFSGDANAGEEHEDYIFARIRDRKELFLNVLDCKGSGSVLTCTLDYDGGKITLTETDGGLTLQTKSPLKLFESGSNNSVQFNVPDDPDNSTYALKKVGKKLCDW
jgi:hypothetical protein